MVDSLPTLSLHVPVTMSSEVEHRRRLASATNEILRILSSPSLAAVSSGIDAPIADSDYGAGWTDLDITNVIYAPATHMEYDLAGLYTFEHAGRYMMTINGWFSHNNSGQDREINIRLNNETENVPQKNHPIFTISGAKSTSVAIVIQGLVTPLEIGDVFRIEVGGGDVYTTIEWSDLNISVWSLELDRLT